jgi:hypothetical protein
MGRAARPSDIYRLPEHTRQAPLRPSTPPPEPPPRLPKWIPVAGAIAGLLVVGGFIAAATDANTGNAPLVDVVTEDHAVAALTLYGAQASTIEKLQVREDILAPPGPGDAAALLANGIRTTQSSLDAAREVVGANPLATGYWNSGAHSDILEEFNRLNRDAQDIAILAATHDTLYGGSGAIPLGQARNQIIGMGLSSASRPPLEDWANALLAQLERRDSRDAAMQAQAATVSLWAFEIKRLEPAAERLLHNYVSQLPPATVDGLHGHPVAGPALKILEAKRGPID